MKTPRQLLILAACRFVGSVFSQTAPASWNALAAGAKGDAVTDSTAVFQRLLDHASRTGGGVVEVPAGCFRISGQVSIPANVTLQGIYRVPPTTAHVAATNLIDRLGAAGLRRARFGRRTPFHPVCGQQRLHRRTDCRLPGLEADGRTDRRQ